MICSGSINWSVAEIKKNSGSLIASVDMKVLYLQTLQTEFQLEAAGGTSAFYYILQEK